MPARAGAAEARKGAAKQPGRFETLVSGFLRPTSEQSSTPLTHHICINNTSSDQMLAHEDDSRKQSEHHHHAREDYRASRARVEEDVRDSDRRGFHPSSSMRERYSDSRPLARESPPRDPPGRERNIESTHRHAPPGPESLYYHHHHHHHHSTSRPAEPADPIDSIPNVPVPNPSKIYIGGLPELTRREDLEDCFSQLGRIKNVELKSGYGFVEYESAQAACDAVSKYHEGTFLGSPIKVEISHGGSRPRHVAVSNNPEACYTCGIIGHWARDCPKADSQIYSKRRLPARSASPPRHRENAHVSRDNSRHEVELSAHEHRRHRHRTPLGEIDYARIERERAVAAPPRESYFLPALPEDKRYRPDHSSFRDRERDELRALDLKVLPRGEEYRAPHLITLSRSRSPPPISREYYINDRTRPMDVYPSRSWPRDDYDARAPVLKSYAQEPPYHRDHARAPEATRISRYEERSPDRKHWDRSVERIVEPTRLDRRYEVPEARVHIRGYSPRRARSPRRSLSPSRRAPVRRRSVGRIHSPPPYEAAAGRLYMPS
ncbi:hypothetical protein PCASD_24007 [Puccinia coronata f. sp. avenae]|uniref:RRM domain-containing protein n=1 Tax=Puccinia coronata f. sp. avenae TaxID=200324 RepID=A0A2N5S0Z3_9BASI|nr:hypothetical protein PCASD_24007 [Puccinia coronata f. sp. avenae]